MLRRQQLALLFGLIALAVCITTAQAKLDDLSTFDESKNELSDLPSSDESIGTELNLQGYTVLRIRPETKWQLQFLRSLEKNATSWNLDFWKSPSQLNRNVDLMVSPDARQEIEKELYYQHIPFEQMIESVEELVQDEKLEMMRNNLHYDTDWRRPMSFFRNYHPLNDIYSYMNYLETEYPDRVQLETIGTTFEKRPMRLMKIGKRRPSKKIVWIDAGIHAREWIAPATSLYIADQLIKGYDQDAQIATLLNEIDFYILPVANPDGYSYTFTHNRLWRKTRSMRPGLMSSLCYGVDPNRNFGYHWGESGSSIFPCSQVFAGTRPFSEPETRAISEKILSVKADVIAYLALHSYSQLFLMPWGYTAILPANYWDMEDKAKKAIKELSKRYGTEYKAGSSTNVLYAAAGGADDWAHGVANIKYSYTIELRDTGDRGFLLPPGQIIPTGEETFDAIRNLTMEIGREHRLAV